MNIILKSVFNLNKRMFSDSVAIDRIKYHLITNRFQCDAFGFKTFKTNEEVNLSGNALMINKDNDEIVGTTRVDDAINYAKLRRTDLIQLYKGDSQLLPVISVGPMKEIIYRKLLKIQNLEKLHQEGVNRSKQVKSKTIMVQTKIKENERDRKVDQLKDFLRDGFNCEINIGMHSQVQYERDRATKLINYFLQSAKSLISKHEVQFVESSLTYKLKIESEEHQSIYSHFDEETANLFEEKGVEYFVTKASMGDWNSLKYEFSSHIQKDLGHWLPASRPSFSDEDDEQLKIAIKEAQTFKSKQESYTSGISLSRFKMNVKRDLLKGRKIY